MLCAYLHIIVPCLCCLLSLSPHSIVPVTWIILGEIFPAEIRGRAISIATSLNWLANIVVAVSMLSLLGTYSMSVCVCPIGVRGWLVISFKSLSLLPVGGAFGKMKLGLSAAYRRNHICQPQPLETLNMTWVFLYQTLSRVLVIGWCPRCY